ncbi:hypothetical protein QV06_09845 [Gallibacterium genomosp. 3]|uniref:Trimeric autotransporter adhesin YadA-like C-terminal membrane anchor domain-containing protein n=1 Tax=Gallibacterium genomosp. 3 TaxID=505345 RepID=A0A1A7PLN5_9PAST|nr:YadA-like family protein [Gallibacterium genomosp. 3]OBX03448.1 hypothetical protein QV06_09845 [Gallibacterium genomosp. 3]
MAGTLVYTDTNGNRVLAENGKYYDTSVVGNKVKANDGLWYDETYVTADGSVDTQAIENAKKAIDADNSVTDKETAKALLEGKSLAQLNDASKLVDPTNGDKSLSNDKVLLSAVNPDGETTSPVTIANLKDNLAVLPTAEETLAKAKADYKPSEHNDKTFEQLSPEELVAELTKAKNALIDRNYKTRVNEVVNALIATELTDASLSKAVTLRDLQTVAQAGLTFMGNDGVSIHRALGTTLHIKGSDTEYVTQAVANASQGTKTANASQYSASNLITHQDGDDTLRIEMKRTPTFDGIVLDGKDGEDGTKGKDGYIGVDKDGNVVVKNGANGLAGTDGKDGKNGASRVITEADIDGTSGENGVSVNLAYKANSKGLAKEDDKGNIVYDDKAATVKLSEGLNFVDGNNTTASIGENGEVKFDLNDKLKNIDSISGKDGEGSLDFGSRDTQIIKKDTNGDIVYKKDDNGEFILDNDGNKIPEKVKEKIIDAGGSVITNIGTPTQENDVANKGYVDSKVSDVDTKVDKLSDTVNTGFTLNTGTQEVVDGKVVVKETGNVGQVKPNTTIVMVDGKNTKVSKVNSGSPDVISYTIEVNGIPMSYVNKDGDTLVKVGDKFIGVNKDGEIDPTIKDTTIAGLRVVNPNYSDPKDNNEDPGLTIDNIADGKVAQGSKQAVNGGQLHATAQSVAVVLGNDFENKDGKVTVKNSTDGIGGTGKTTISEAFKEVVKRANIEVMGDNNITVETNKTEDKKTYTVKLKQDITVGNSITVGKGKVKLTSESATEGTDEPPALNVNNARITGVANGVQDSDVATMGQVRAFAADTTKVINNVNKRISDLTRESRAGIAGAMATAGLQQTSVAGRTTVSVGTATFKGESAVAIGFSKLSDSGKVGIRISGMTTSNGDAGGSVSVGYTW